MLHEIKTERRHKTHCYRFESLPELYRWLDSAERTWRQRSAQFSGASNSWDLNAGYKGAMAMAKGGWIEGAQRVAKTLKAFKAPEREPQETLAVQGTRPCVPAYLAGSPRCMWRHKQEGAAKQPVLRLYVQVGALYNVKAEYMANIGAAIAQYIKTIEAQGTQCEVWGASYSGNSRNGVSFAWRVKRADQPLDLPMLAFSIGHPAMHRRVVFALRERSSCPELSGYGSTGPINPSRVIDPPKGVRYINGMMDANRIARTPEAAYDWLKKQVEAG